MELRNYEPADLKAVQRIWKECGWVESDDEAAQLEHFFEDADVTVAVLDDAECAVSTHTGVVSYAGCELPLSVVSSVTTSLIGRKQGLARAATAQALANAADGGAAVSLLGMFEQGFYDLLGFGSGPSVLHYRFDPAGLKVDNPTRVPVRVTIDDVEEIHDATQRRRLSHGGINLDSAARWRAELAWETPHFGLGYRDDSGRLSHFVWGKTKGESGPWRVSILSYQNSDQLMELLSLIKSLGDQVRAIDLMEPPEVQLQDLVRHPNRQRIVTNQTEFQTGGRANAWWQARILDLETCVGARSWGGDPVAFNLDLSDPLTNGDASWRGIGGSYTVEISRQSGVTSGSAPSLPTLTASVNAFTRMWLGARSASSLAVTETFDGPPELLNALDEAFRLPPPHTGMYV